MDALISAFNAAKVRYLLIGGQAIRLKGMPRFSMDCETDIAFLEAKKTAGNLL